MARIKITDSAVQLWLSANDTHAWAWRAYSRWPCSYAEGKPLYAQFDSTGLCDMALNYGRGEQDMPGDEFNAITSDHLRDKLPATHPAYFVTVGQFDTA